MEEATRQRTPWTRSQKLRLALVSAILCASVVSAMYFEATDPLECGERRDLTDPLLLSISLAIVALIVAGLYPPRLRMESRVDAVNATVLMAGVTIILALIAYLLVVPAC